MSKSERLARRSGFYADRVAAITGAGSGIGRALALALADHGCHLALSDVNEARLRQVMAETEGRGVKVSGSAVDVSDRAAVFGWADQSKDDHGRVNFIFNNAGVAVVAPVEDLSFDDFQWLININFWGVVNGTQAFLPHLKEAGRGHVTNISSVFGLQAIPTQSAYNASKFAVRGFTDALRIELDAQRCGVSSSTVHPGGVKTRIALDARFGGVADDEHRKDAARFERIAMTTPEGAADKILTGVAANRRRILVGPDAYFFDAVSRLPAWIPQRGLAAMVRPALVKETATRARVDRADGPASIDR